MPKVIYLTGAPASGKSSTLRLLLGRRPDILGWEYGAKLTERLRRRSADVVDQIDLRRKSAGVASPADIVALDEELIGYVAHHRRSSHIVIDTHPVTKEEWGFRITPFSFERFARLAPDEIWMLYTPPESALERIEKHGAGRPTVTLEQARMHTALQGAVAATYGMSLGHPVYLFDSSGDQGALVSTLEARLS